MESPEQAQALVRRRTVHIPRMMLMILEASIVVIVDLWDESEAAARKSDRMGMGMDPEDAVLI